MRSWIGRISNDERVMLTVQCCPLCGSTHARVHSIPEPNLYSEKLASLTGVAEQELLVKHANVQCRACGLIYKRHWFGQSLLQGLFTGAVALHPKGWDAVLGRFKPENLRKIFEMWALAHQEGQQPQIRRGERELISLLDSIPPRDDQFDRAAATTAIRSGDVAAFRPMVDAIAATMKEPITFKRFSGFRSVEMWGYLQEKLVRIESYAEVGCPLWGLLSVAAMDGVPATYLQRDEVNYWGQGCQHQGLHCLQKVQETHGIHIQPWQSEGRHTVIGLFQYLDHLMQPVEFMQEVFSRADAAAVILDGVDQPVAIQHFTGWTDGALQALAKRFGKQLHQDFDSIRASGNVLYLFVTP